MVLARDSCKADESRSAMPQQKPLHLLAVVDDDVDATEAVAALLQASEFAVACFPSGDAFLAAFDALLPDAVVLDLAMPGTGGVEVLRTLREEKAATLPVVILSGKDEGQDLVRSRRLGATATLRKPADVTALAGVLDRALESRESEIPASSAEAEAPALAAAAPRKKT
jgi:DNA-binding response OmpR family regulator